MRPTGPNEWWWCTLDGEKVVAQSGHGTAHITGYRDSIDIDSPRIVWLGPVAPFAPSPDPAAPDASDETRLAARWVQQTHEAVHPDTGCFRRPADGPWIGEGYTPAPGPAGLWRLHASGVWVRWVVAS